MFLNNDLIKKEYKKTTTKTVLGIVLLTAALLLLLMGTLKVSNARRNMLHLNDVIVTEADNKENQIAYLDMVGFFQFATYGDDHGYYIAYDDDFFYLIGFPDKDFDYFAQKFDTQESVRVYGYTKKIPEEAKPYAIDTLNEELEQKDYVSYSTFDDIFGDVMLEVKRDNSVLGLGAFLELSLVELLFAVFAAIGGTTLLAVGLADRKSFNLSEIDNELLGTEIESPDTMIDEKLKLMLTDRHLISYNGKIDVIPYEDICWAYTTKHSTNGIADYDFLNICQNNGKRLICGNGRTLGKKHREATTQSHQQILTLISEKNPEAMIGYDKEKVDAYSRLLKQIKGK